MLNKLNKISHTVSTFSEINWIIEWIKWDKNASLAKDIFIVSDPLLKNLAKL